MSLAPPTGEEPSPAVQGNVPNAFGSRTDASTAVMPVGSVAVIAISIPSVAWLPTLVASTTYLNVSPGPTVEFDTESSRQTGPASACEAHASHTRNAAAATLLHRAFTSSSCSPQRPCAHAAPVVLRAPSRTDACLSRV